MTKVKKDFVNKHCRHLLNWQLLESCRACENIPEKDLTLTLNRKATNFDEHEFSEFAKLIKSTKGQKVFGEMNECGTEFKKKRLHN